MNAIHSVNYVYFMMSAPTMHDDAMAKARASIVVPLLQ